MRPDALLQSACELSYDIARQGLESDPPIEAPQAMRGFLRSGRLTDRALTVARSAIDEDPAFRRRVAEQADQDAVGRAGYLWLHRPIGWAAEFENLVSADENANGSGGAADGDSDSEPESVPAVSDSAEGEPVYPTSHDDQDPDSSNEANAIESELSSLRGLVDRLASERKAVASSAERVEQQVQGSRQQPSVFDTDIYTLQSELDSARADLEQANQERDTAIQQHSAALTRQLELEKELDNARERQASIERDHEDADSELVMLREQVTVAEGAVEPLRGEVGTLTEQIEAVKVANTELTDEVERITTERNDENRASELRIHELESDLDDLRKEHESLAASSNERASEIEDLQGKLGVAATQAEESSSLVEMLTEEKIDVASRLADTESMLDTTRTQLNNVKADAEALAADLSNVKAHRDGLSTQVEELHASLSEALDNLARVRSTSDADRASLKEVRTERDQLKVRVSSLEQAEAGAEAKLEAVTTERDALTSQVETANTERSDAERKLRELEDTKVLLEADKVRHEQAMTDMAGERDAKKSELEQVTSELTEAQSQRDGLAQQIEQLTAENAAIQDQLVESDRLRVETSESQGHALSELAQRLSQVERERAKLEAKLGESDDGDELVSGSVADTDDEAAAEADDDVKADKADDDEVDKADDAEAEADGDDELAAAEVEDDPAEQALAAVISAEDGDEAPQDSGRITNRHNWSLGQLRRGGGRARRGSNDEQPAAAIDSDVDSPVDDEFEAIAAAVAEATHGVSAEVDAVDPLDDQGHFTDVGAQLAEALGEPEPARVGADDDEDELDAISNLISQTVSDMKLGATGELAGAADGKPPSIFTDGAAGDPFGDDTSSIPRSAGPSTTPPSVLDPVVGRSNRRQITIPDELMGDELEVARHIVSSPDVVLLVDGDSVARMGWPSLPVVQQRDALVSYLADLSASTGVAPDIVFDGRKGEEDALPESRAVRIRLSTPPTEPTAALDELVDAYPEQWPIAVVTDNDALAGSAGDRGASVLSNGQLLDLFIDP
ncbi:MAG: hypothetical protein AAF962_20175 [Actinomycetota bacterium]